MMDDVKRLINWITELIEERAALQKQILMLTLEIEWLEADRNKNLEVKWLE